MLGTHLLARLMDEEKADLRMELFHISISFNLYISNLHFVGDRLVGFEDGIEVNGGLVGKIAGTVK